MFNHDIFRSIFIIYNYWMYKLKGETFCFESFKVCQTYMKNNTNRAHTRNDSVQFSERLQLMISMHCMLDKSEFNYSFIRKQWHINSI